MDLTKLNQWVKREQLVMPCVEQTLAQLHDATVFSKLDANAGFWQIPLSQESAALTTFVTPLGRYHFNRLPFGITSAPEVFQKQMSQTLDDLGVLCILDILVYGPSQGVHDERLVMVLEKLRDRNHA